METLKVAMLGGWSSAIAFKAVGVETHILSATDDPLGAWESRRPGGKNLDRRPAGILGVAMAQKLWPDG